MSTTTRPTYSDWLREKMRERDISGRALARNWSASSGRSEDATLRAVRRYLAADATPRKGARDEIAALLGTVESGPAEDDEESEPLNPDVIRAQQIAEVLMASLREVIRETVREETAA